MNRWTLGGMSPSAVIGVDDSIRCHVYKSLVFAILQQWSSYRDDTRRRDIPTGSGQGNQAFTRWRMGEGFREVKALGYH